MDYKTELLKFEVPVKPGNLFDPHNLRLMHATLGLASEVGEFANLVKKPIFQNKHVDYERYIDELGDVYWYLLLVCDVLGVSTDELAEGTFKKLSGRHSNVD